MKVFSGFPEGKVPLTPVPAQFFSQLLAEIDHLGELKVTLYVFWRLDRQEGTFRYLHRSDFLADERFMQGLGSSPEQSQAILDEALERCVRRGTLLRAQAGPDQAVYFLNSPKGRAGAQAIEKGAWRPSGDAEHPLEVYLDAPNIFRLYEEHIGPLTPMISESLRDAEENYPAAWIEEAIRIAVENNKRSWRYIIAILERWQQEGRHERKDRRDTEKDRRRYADWEDPGNTRR
jgi:DnaD/phage-associated family protein